ERVVMAEAPAIPKIAALYARTPIATLKAWHGFHLVDAAAPYLSKRFVTAHFEFQSKNLEGLGQAADRWKRGVSLVATAMGRAIGRIYVKRYLSPESKAQMSDLVEQIRAAMKRRIETVSWMSAKSKSKALEKLGRLRVKIGHPDEWRDYSKLEIRSGELVDNVRNAKSFEWMRKVARLNSPVDRDEWEMTPQTLNTHYSTNLDQSL